MSIFNEGEELAVIVEYIFPSLEIKPDNNNAEIFIDAPGWQKLAAFRGAQNNP